MAAILENDGIIEKVLTFNKYLNHKIVSPGDNIINFTKLPFWKICCHF